jgi:signal peptidase I
MVKDRQPGPLIPKNLFISLSQEVLKKGGVFSFQAKGWSMFPSIRDGDVLNVEPVNPEQIKQGDIIFYRMPDKGMVAHRVVKKSFCHGRPFILARGDFTAGKVEGIFLEDILGRIKTIERNSKLIHLDRSRGRFMDRFYASTSPFIKINKKMAARLIRRIQGARAYRKIAKRFVKEAIKR